MKSRLILQQHLPLAHMIGEALEFSASMLLRSETLYPFGLVCVEKNIHNIFVPYEGQHPQTHMIESLQSQIEDYKRSHSSASGLLVYAADIEHPKKEESEALVFMITDAQGHNTVTLYPYKRTQNSIKMSCPCTCDFLD